MSRRKVFLYLYVDFRTLVKYNNKFIFVDGSIEIVKRHFRAIEIYVTMQPYSRDKQSKRWISPQPRSSPLLFFLATDNSFFLFFQFIFFVPHFFFFQNCFWHLFPATTEIPPIYSMMTHELEFPHKGMLVELLMSKRSMSNGKDVINMDNKKFAH